MGDSEKTLTLVLKARNLASREVDRLRGSLDKTAKSSGWKSIAKGVGLGAGIGAFGLLTSAIGGVTDALSGAIQGALDDEESISRLGASLKANIPAWDGNTAAIEKTLEARMKLGFSDDEQRDSLARAVVATHDATKALDLQRTAMDLARLKGISLGDATDALIKVEGGQYRALKALGIVLPANATATDALKAVQAAAQGQAESYANTNKGKLLVSQVKVGEAMEKFGTAILPGVADIMGVAADVAVTLAEAATKYLVPAFSFVLDIVGRVIGAISGLIGWIKDALGAFNKLFDASSTTFKDAAGRTVQGGRFDPRRATGGPVSGWSIVGENGPELHRFGPGSSVTPTHALRGDSRPQVIVLQIDGKTVAQTVVPAVSRQMFYELQRAAPTLVRT